MIYTVKRIDEDLDFGCEERVEGALVMAVVTLIDSSGEELKKAGQPVDWKCPFCGGNVVLMKNEDGHTVIGCEECDMRMNLESN